MPQVIPVTQTAPSLQHVLVLGDDTKAKLTIQHRPLNKSARLDAMGTYLKAVWTSTPTLGEAGRCGGERVHDNALSAGPPLLVSRVTIPAQIS